jgi:hypothetical protein
MVTDNKKRCIIITHPSFNEGGTDGIKEARHFGNQIMQVVKSDELFKHVPESQHEELREHLKKFKIIIRKLDPDVLAKKR